MSICYDVSQSSRQAGSCCLKLKTSLDHVSLKFC